MMTPNAANAAPQITLVCSACGHVVQSGMVNHEMLRVGTCPACCGQLVRFHPCKQIRFKLVLEVAKRGT